MKNTILLALLGTFEEKELDHLEKSIASSIYLKNRSLRNFFSLLRQFYPDFDDPKLADESLYGSIYPGKEFDETLLNEQTSLLFKITQEYLVESLLNARKRRKSSSGIGESRSKATLDLLERRLECKAYHNINGKYLNHFVFRNILCTSVDLAEYKWAEEYIGKYAPQVKPGQEESIKNFAFAIIEYKKGNLEDSLEYVITVEYDSFLLKADFKRLNLLVFYELELYEEAKHFLEITGKYSLTTEEFYPALKEEDDNFLYYYKLLLKSKYQPDKGELEIGSRKLRSEEMVIQKPWLMHHFEKLAV